MLTAQDLERLAREHIQAENERDLAKIMGTVAGEGLYYHMTPMGETYDSHAKVESFYSEFARALPDVQVTVREVVVDVERRRVACEFHFTGRVSKPLWGLAPCRKPLEVNGAVHYEFNPEGKLIREVTYLDQTHVLASMGLIASTHTELGRLLLFVFQSPLYALKCGWYKLFPGV